MKVELTGRAEAQADTASLWWRENRQAAPSLFDKELAEALELLMDLPQAGVPYRARPEYRRLLLRRSGYHIYYRVDERAAVLYVVSVWHTRRGRPPRL